MITVCNCMYTASSSSSICLSRDRSIASSKLRSPKSAILSLSPDEESRIFLERDCPGKVVMW
jgi:hypothetical protein